MIDLGFTYDEALQENTFEPIEEGTYQVQVQNVETRVGKLSNKPYLNFTMNIVNHPTASNRKLFYIVSLDRSAISKRKLLTAARSLGVTWTGTQIDPEVFIGKIGTVRVVYAKDPSTGQAREWGDGQPDMNIYFQA